MAGALVSAAPVTAQENPFLRFWFGPSGGEEAAAGADGARATKNLVYRAPRADVDEAEWEDPLDPTGAGGLFGPDEDMAMPVDMANTVPILSSATEESLKAAIARYQQIVERGGWPQVPLGETLRTGVHGPRVVRLRERLMATGDLRQRSGTSNAFDSFVQQALIRFQRRHGLRPDGLANERTINALNVPARARLSQLRINLSRIVQMRAGVADRFVMVNIPGAEIEAVRGGVVEQRHRTVVGKIDRPTPIVKSRIVQLNFYPYWHVPQSIVRKDLVPILQEDLGYLQRTNLHVYSDWSFTKEVDPQTVDWTAPSAEGFKFRQDPGEDNALGYVRINFPNEHDVFLHDTPKRGLFGNELRAESSGCVRVQNVDDLVTWILDGQDDWNAARVQGVIQVGKSRDVDLARAVPIYMIYITAWATEDGTVHFRRDLYARDGVGEIAANY